MSFVILDIEARQDLTLLRSVYGKPAIGENETDAERAEMEKLALAMFLDTYNAGRAVTTDFLPLPFHVPISIAVGKVSDTYELEKCYTIPGDEREMVADFWRRAETTLRSGATLVTYNGRRYDLAVLELAALRYGIPIFPKWFDRYAGRYRWNEGWHEDLSDVLDNYSAVRLHGGLDGMLKLCGLQGKGSVDGSMVQGMWEAGRLEEIHQYCRDDVALRTYPLFLRIEHWRGRLTPERYAELTAPKEG
jgi:3'-5' exonuclease